MITKYESWTIINWHKIIKKLTYTKYICLCWRCWSFKIANTYSMKKTKWCNYCTKKYTSLQRLEYVYNISKYKIAWRLHRWYTLNQTLWLEPLSITKETLNKFDLNYIKKNKIKDWSNTRAYKKYTNKLKQWSLLDKLKKECKII